MENRKISSELRPQSAHPRRIGVTDAPNITSNEGHRKVSTGRNGRRKSLTFEEWSLAVEERDKQKRRQMFDVRNKEKGSRKNSLTFDEWNQLVEEKQKQEQRKRAEIERINKEKKAALEEQKFGRKISFEQWMDQKSNQKESKIGASQGRRSSIAGVNEKEFEKRDKEEIEKAFQKWLLKKEEEKLSDEEHKLWLALHPPKKTATKKNSSHGPPSTLVRKLSKDSSNPQVRRSSAPSRPYQGKAIIAQ
uniref:Stress response protein NST1 n=1 Tax=Ciona intestinalis TaxID=7719 RepID=F6SAV8_CIOIN|nr:stress response protein NST1 [Ciona intestinalis]|eukprot:XP_002128455.1 stress response protein NST1 [Ciona intestinalis]